MKTTMNRFWSVPGLLVLAVLLVALIAISNQLFKGWRLDLTENQLYTMTDGTKSILQKIDEPLNLYFYFSDAGTTQMSQLRSYAKRVREMLEEYELRSGGKINLSVIDPLPFSEEEDQAAQFGLQAVPVTSAGDAVFFGLVGTNALDDQVVIPFFHANKESFLEYDLSKLVHTLANPKKPVIGLMSGLPLNGSIDPMSQRPIPEWMIATQIKQLFDVRPIALDIREIPQEIDVLLVVHPKTAADETQFAIEQFMLRGGRVAILVDPHADADQPVTDPNDPASMFQSRASTLAKLFVAWGLEFSTTEFVADSGLSLPIQSPDGRGQIRHIGLLGLSRDQINQDDVISADLENINVGYAGSLTLAENAPITMEPILETSTESALLDSQSLLFSQDPNDLKNNFVPDDKLYVIGARISGTVNTAFPELVDEASGHVSSGDISAIVIADTDFLIDGFWVQVQNFFGQRMANAFAGNGDLVFNALDNLTGSNDLISIRSRETFLRPFEKVEGLKRDAEEAFRQTEEQLQQELMLTEQRLGELQANRTDEGVMIMSQEQQSEIDQFLQQKVQIRKKLREVRRNLEKDIEQLGFLLKVLNILAIPILLTLFVLLRVWRTGRERKQ